MCPRNHLFNYLIIHICFFFYLVCSFSVIFLFGEKGGQTKSSGLGPFPHSFYFTFFLFILLYYFVLFLFVLGRRGERLSDSPLALGPSPTLLFILLYSFFRLFYFITSFFVLFLFVLREPHTKQKKNCPDITT